MYLLKNIDISKLDYYTLSNIIKSLGCNYEKPFKEENKYLRKRWDLVDEKKFWEEEERIIKKFNEDFEQYFRNVIDWLKENGYAEEIND